MVAAGAFAAMLVWTVPEIRAGDPAVKLFDEFFHGYGFDDARAILNLLTDAGRKTYLGPQRVLDTVFPIALTATLMLGIFLTLRAWSKPIAVLLGLFPIGFFAADMAENAAVANLLVTDMLSPELVAVASGWTRLKWQLLAAGGGLFVLCLLLRGLVGFVGVIRRGA